MEFAATIRIFFVLILALGFIDQHNSSMLSSSFAEQEMVNHPANSGNFSSQELIDVQHGDDILGEAPAMKSSPEFFLLDAVTFLVPAPVLTGPSPCWQPPEFRS